MKKLMIIVTLALAMTALAPSRASATCTAGGYCGVYLCNWYNWVASSDFSSPSCWTFSGNVVAKSDSQFCGGGVYHYYAQFNQVLSASTLSQTFHIASSTEPGYVGHTDPTHFEFDYRVEITDPNASAIDVLTINLVDAHSGAQLQHIATIHGYDTALNCTSASVDFHNSSLLGKDVRIEINGSVPYANARFKVTNVALWQSTQ